MAENERVHFKTALPVDLKQRLEHAAVEHRRSVSAEIIHRLEASFPDMSSTGIVHQAAVNFSRLQATGSMEAPFVDSGGAITQDLHASLIKAEAKVELLKEMLITVAKETGNDPAAIEKLSSNLSNLLQHVESAPEFTGRVTGALRASGLEGVDQLVMTAGASSSSLPGKHQPRKMHQRDKGK